ncbi:protein-disulfide reductase DsbD domain-containing protein [Nitrincola sp. A-D6]|uniref:protein-disulfide reductase DsbD domain-containing protein n=1 Tax=Nitrincola sp. A-D6 TaxID=1545442 RepID=UPI00136392C8|nr:protein-disulfide reductase DsbD domain-containing protein [Nitrincola sp. A-D6]
MADNVGARSPGDVAAGDNSLGDRFLSIFNSSGTSAGPLPVEEVFQLDTRVVAPGVFELNWSIHDDYYLYRDHLKFTLPEGVQLVESWRQVGVTKDDPLFGKVDVWTGQAAAALLIGADAEVVGNASLEITYQAAGKGYLLPAGNRVRPLIYFTPGCGPELARRYAT